MIRPAARVLVETSPLILLLGCCVPMTFCGFICSRHLEAALRYTVTAANEAPFRSSQTPLGVDFVLCYINRKRG